MFDVNDDNTPNRVIVRLSSSYWNDCRGCYTKRSLTFLKKKCTGFNFFSEDLDVSSAEEIIPKIKNLNQCDDGVYEIITINHHTDWESGYIDDYDFKLIPWGC